jgi:hypothetical protein
MVAGKEKEEASYPPYFTFLYTHCNVFESNKIVHATGKISHTPPFSSSLLYARIQ